jgi:O-antigen/teichoic acid export membrane protein
MDLHTIITATFRILGTALIPVVLYLGGGIYGCVLVLLFSGVFTLIGHLLISARLLPELVGTAIDRSIIREFLKFGGSLVVAGLAVALLANLEKLLLSPLVSVQSLAYFSVAFTFANLITTFASSMAQSLLPAFSRLIGAGKHTEFNSLFARGMRLNILCIIPVIAFFMVVARPFFTVWAGAEFGRETVVPFYILMAGLSVSGFAYMPYCAVVAAGRSDIIAKLYWLEVIVFLGITVVLVSTFGLIGAAISWSLRAVVDGASLIILAQKAAGITSGTGIIVKPFTIGVLLLTPSIIFSIVSSQSSIWPMVTYIASVIAYVIIAWRSLLLGEERDWLKQRFGGLFIYAWE